MKKGDFKYIFKIIKPFIVKEIIGFLVIIMSTVLSLAKPFVIKLIIDNSIAQKNVHNLIIFNIIFFTIFILVTLLGIIQNYIFTFIGQKLLYNLRMKLYETVINQRITFFNEKQTGEIMSRILNELPNVVNLFSATLINIITQVATLIVTFSIMYILNKQITLISMIVTPFIFIVFRYYNPIFRKINMDFMHIYAKINNVLQENISNIKLLKYTKTYKYSKRNFSVVMHEYIDKTYENLYIQSISNSILSFLFFIPSMVLLLYGGMLVIQGKLTIGSIVALSSYLNQLFQPIQSLANINIDLQKSLAAFRRYREIADINTEIDDISRIEKRNVNEIKIKNITFGYNEKNDIISNLSCEFHKGQVIRITGANGKGKTTLIDIICGLLKPKDGTVLYDDLKIDNIKNTSMKNLIGIVPQDTYLFNDTIKNNIKLGRDIDDNKIISLANKLGFNDIIDGEKVNLNLMLANNGENLSGGQRRKITILRGLIHDPQIIILDEAMTFLDEESKRNLCKYIEEVRANKIIILISHEDVPYIDVDFELEIENELLKYI
ncbi:ABC transporter ATP-binding protein [Thermoanaerobacterium thermosaccharolyticum]|uniref:ABC transporter ATP-binding protein n=1 Tax=Thermoanaerobacterium thermosaccharolyticum TaxID=1517 RepID=UPI003DA82FC2